MAKVIKQYTDTYNGNSISVKVFENKKKKDKSYGRVSLHTCPNCLSQLKLNESGIAYCTGDKLEYWLNEFAKFELMSDQQKVEYIQTISDYNEFLNLYDRWKWVNESETKEVYNCGYTNKIFFPIPTCNVIIPDPVKVAHIQSKLGRELTEEEMFGESELWEFGGSVYEKFRKGARKVRIQLIRFPQDC